MKKKIVELDKIINNKPLGEFKQFILRGNVVDMAVGVIIGGAFNKIVSSLVSDVIMPFIGLFIGKFAFDKLIIKIGTSEIKYGLFIQNIVNFLLIGLSIFIIIKLMNQFRKKQEEEKPKVIKSDEVLLLEEIRDLLKKK